MLTHSRSVRAKRIPPTWRRFMRVQYRHCSLCAQTLKRISPIANSILIIG